MIKVNVLGKQPDQDQLDSAWLWTIPAVILLGLLGYSGYRVYTAWHAKSDDGIQIITIPVTEEEKLEFDPYKRRNQIAQDLFDLHNALYFGGKLPNAIIRYKPMDNAYGATVAETIHTQTPIIYLDPKTNTGVPQIGMTLLHEECHLSLGEAEPVRGTDHGKLFDGCMYRLARIGAMTRYW